MSAGLAGGVAGKFTVRRADPRSPEGRALLAASSALMASLYPPEHNHALGLDELARPHIAFLLAEDEEGPVGCAALARKAGYAEVKSMFVDPGRRGGGAGAALLAAVEDLARAEGIGVLRLETGDDLEAARALYRRAGFAERGPFGDYAEGPRSVFMEKVLA